MHAKELYQITFDKIWSFPFHVVWLLVFLDNPKLNRNIFQWQLKNTMAYFLDPKFGLLRGK